ncbi:MAG: hypothetical protein DRJ52_06975 [Thermoprotei archaeon]|nr:MAG: hypothetical protein DRJ52_06975 [Thermoprotei archaeon]HDI74682.1 DUF1743 domain-containing protein [Thermoprotei archaeon]
MLLRIGFDDTDHYKGGCTTYLCSLIVERLEKKATFLDYPHLIRLNPNIPFKTRGNAAVALKVECEDPEDVVDLVWNVISENYSGKGKADPSLVAIKGEVPEEVKCLSMRALHEFLPLSYVARVLKKVNVEQRFIKRGRGLVGAAAAIGFLESDFIDFTYELLTYRNPEFWGKPRRVEYESIEVMDRALRPYVFANIDYKKKRPLILSHGPDPVIYGIRGDFPSLLVEAMKMIKVYEPIDRWIIFKTNQCTGVHLFMRKKIPVIRPYDSLTVRGIIVQSPIVIKGGHVLVKISDGEKTIDCVFYKKTRLNVIATLIKPGDLIEVSGGVKPRRRGLTLNVEEVKIIQQVIVVEKKPPVCPICGTKMKSKGKNLYRCRRCKYSAEFVDFEIRHRNLPKYPLKQAPSAYRHLTKPREREGLESFIKKGVLIERWHYP